MINILKVIFKNNYIKDKKKLFFGFLWVLCFFPININPENINKLNFIEILRFIIPPLLILFFFIYSAKKKITFYSIEKFNIFYPFIFYFILGIYFIFVNPNINSYLNIYFGILMLISFIYIYSFKNDVEQLQIFLNLSFLLLLSIFFYFFLKIIVLMILKKEIMHLYGISSPKFDLVDNDNPRSSGLSRMSLILYIWFVVYLITSQKKTYVINSLFVLIVILGSILLAFQSRTTNFIYIIFSIILIIIFFKKKNLFNKNYIFYLIVTPIILASVYLSFSMRNTNDPTYLKLLRSNQASKDNNFYEYGKSIVTKTIIRNDNGNFSSNRFDMWKKTIEISKKNIFIGYGFQADRKLLRDSIHNVYLYSLISGGLISMLLIIFISLRSAFTSFILLNNFINSKNTCTAFYVIPIFLVPLFLLRGILETSYGIYSIDYLFFIICFLINELNYKKI